MINSMQKNYNAWKIQIEILNNFGPIVIHS